MKASKRPVRRQPARTLMVGVSLLAVGLAAPVHGQERAMTVTEADRGNGMVENRYFMMLMAQTFDGSNERSHSQKAGFARLRKGDESWINIDYGDGAMVIVRPGQVAVGNFVNQTPTEIALAYDYRTHSLRGNSVTSGYHNRYVRPLLGRSPPLGSDAAWQIQVTPEQMGVPGATGGALTIELKRHYFSHGGRQYVLIDYAAPAFSYKNAAGETIVHWARGAALADPGFGQIYWNGSLQRAVAQPVAGDPRPYRYARTIFAMDSAGKPLIDPADIPELKPYVADFYSREATAPIPTVATAGEPDQTPLQLAALLDVVALSVAENSANQLGEAVGSYALGETGQNAGIALDAITYGFGIPEKFTTFLGAVAQIPVNISEAEFLRRAGISLADMDNLLVNAKNLAAQGQQIQQRAQELRTELQLVARNGRQFRETFNQAVARANNLDELLGGGAPGMSLALIKANEESAQRVLKEMTKLEALAQTNLAAARQVEANLGPLQQLMNVMQQRGYVTAAQDIGEALKQYKVGTALSVFGHLGNASQIYQVRENLGNFDPGKGGDLALSGNYDSAGGFVGHITLNLMGIVGNVATGNVAGAVSDVSAFASGSFTDLYMAMEAASHAQGEAEYAHKQHMLTLMRKAKLDQQHMEKFNAEFQAHIAELGGKMAELQREIDNRPPSDITGNDWRDPRFDSVTGLPIPDYWAWLKENDPQALARMGIDPEAPVGGWPGGRRPGPAQPPQIVQPRQPGGPDYPQAPPRPAEQADARDAARDAANNTAGAQDDPSAPTATDAATAATRAAEAANRDAGQIAGELADQANEAANQVGGQTAAELAQQAAEARGPDWAAEGPAPLDVSPLEVKPITFEPVTFTPVTFKPVTFEPVTWEPPVWVPPEFVAPKPLQLPWPDFGDDQYDFGGNPNNLAFDYGDMNGKVNTDLSKWAKWLKTQNVRELERMALAAGYPNLASALADATNLIRLARDTGFRRWAYDIPAMSGSIGLWASEAQHNLARAQLVLGDILALSRDIFSTGGLSDVGISGFDLRYLLRDFGIQDGDIIDVELLQFGRTIFTTRLDLLNDGTRFLQTLRPGVAQLIITAVNEGFSSPNTAEIQIDNVVRGESTQSYSLNTGQTAVLRIESNAKPED